MSKNWPRVSFHRVSILKACPNLLLYATVAVITSLGTITLEAIYSKMTLGRCLKFSSFQRETIFSELGEQAIFFFFAYDICPIHAE